TRRIWSTALRRSQPDFCCGCVETITSLGSSCSIASRTAATGSDSTTTPVAGTPSFRSSSRVLSRRRRLARVVVDDVALARLVHGRDDGDLHRSAAGVLLDHVDQPPRDDRLVGDDEDVALLGAHGVATSSTSCACDGARTACCAPGTPYSYGEPTTCGISSKLKIGGGELTCHSSVSARHGFAGA